MTSAAGGGGAPPDLPGRPGAIVLAGGRARRMSGEDKLRAPVGGTAVLARVLVACAGLAPVLVGPPELAAEHPGVPVVREEPPYGGPVAALRTGLAALPPDRDPVLVLAGDQPFLDVAAFTELARALGDDSDAALFVDADGRDQYLCALWRRTSLDAGLADPAAGAMRALYAAARLIRVPDHRRVSADVDTHAALGAARARARRGVR